MEGKDQSANAMVATINNMERQWNDAILRRDVASAASFQAPEFKLVVGAEGQPLQVIPRELWLSVLPRYVIHRHEITDVHVSIWNDVAVATLALTQKAEPLNHRDISGNFLITDIWVRRDENWLIAERHSSRQEKASAPVRGAFQTIEMSH
ncbi:nuclear transport factor 2 family protein [Telmatobacter sp. DSM 110680]|uniref:Nuclear transport factor 2 family protein n=1 Tax=Telmatobacter sp. DSM 110680 TaxID=3036704 RepID=A0AAU7DLQ4_9BACT